MIPVNLYSIVFLYSVIALTFISFSTVGKSYTQIRRGTSTFLFALIICAVFSWWLGQRPNGPIFGDSVYYAHDFNRMLYGYMPPDKGEWLWDGLMLFCVHTMDVSSFFTIISVGYFGFTLWACKRLTPNNVLVTLLFCMGAFSFYSYGVNGIRNGLACSVTLVSLSYMMGNKKDKIIAGVLAFVAYNIHHTTGLPILMGIMSLFFIRSFKDAYIFWILSILLSLVAGNAITSLFVGLGFDDRLSYLTTLDTNKFTHTGFRWDFLIYSMMPIVLGYYIVIKRGIRDRNYTFLLNTYTLANAFWVMVIRANYSNRFAYLSWFMYPIVLAYPLLKLDIWGNAQGTYLKQIMLANVGFTWFMQTFYW